MTESLTSQIPSSQTKNEKGESNSITNNNDQSFFFLNLSVLRIGFV